jgi:hypothetical protein
MDVAAAIVTASARQVNSLRNAQGLFLSFIVFQLLVISG